MPSLALHQVRVAAAAKFIADNFAKPIHKQDVILACLFHDIGNILKFDLTIFPEALQPEGIEYWRAIKDDYRKKYGADQHEATIKIAREIGLSDEVISCISIVAFSKAEEVLQNGSWEQKICEYADSRVAPGGIASLEDRLRDARKRYLARHTDPGAISTQDGFEILLEAERQIERQIFEETSITSEDITDTAIAPIIEELWEYPVP